jgi:hypothetical protein
MVVPHTATPLHHWKIFACNGAKQITDTREISSTTIKLSSSSECPNYYSITSRTSLLPLLLSIHFTFRSLQAPKNNHSTPTFEDLSIDDNLSELERVVRYCKSSIGLQRLVHVKLLFHVAKSVGYELCPFLPCLFSSRTDPPSDIKQLTMKFSQS